MNTASIFVNGFFAGLITVAAWQAIVMYKKMLNSKREAELMVARARQRANGTKRSGEQTTNDVIAAEMAIRENRWYENNPGEFRCHPAQKIVR